MQQHLGLAHVTYGDRQPCATAERERQERVVPERGRVLFGSLDFESRCQQVS